MLTLRSAILLVNFNNSTSFDEIIQVYIQVYNTKARNDNLLDWVDVVSTNDKCGV